MVNVGVIGLRFGEWHIRRYSATPEARVLAIADLMEDRLRFCTETYHIPRAVKGYRELLTMPDIDAVSVCLPTYLHAPVAMEALRAGKHVLVEKPMAKTVSEAEAMIAAAKSANRTLAVSVNYRWDQAPESWYLKDLIDRGRLRRIYYIRAAFVRLRTFPRGFKTWFSQKEYSGGGTLIDMGPHMLDLAMWLAGDYHPVQVGSVTRNAIMTDVDVEDFATLLIRLKKGATVHLLSTWASFTRPETSLTILGTEGGAILDFNQPQGKRMTLFGADGETLVDTIPVDIRLPVAREATIQAHFVQCIQEGREPETKPEHGLAVMRVFEAAYRSSETGRDVAIQW